MDIILLNIRFIKCKLLFLLRINMPHCKICHGSAIICVTILIVDSLGIFKFLLLVTVL